MLFEAPAALDMRRTLGWYRYGGGDPTTRLSVGAFARATLTPDGPGTVWMAWRRLADGPDLATPAGGAPSTATAPRPMSRPLSRPVSWFELQVRSWGPGGPWLEARAAAMAGVGYRAPALPPGTPRHVADAAGRFAGVATGASGTLYHELLPTVLAQRITGGEACAQWRRLVWQLGQPAPGPLRLRLPPEPAVLASTPSWAMHRLGVERKRADALREVARHAPRLWSWAGLAPADAAVGLQRLRGIGVWTAASVAGPALGDDDAVPVGDFHFKNTISWSLAGEPRGDDDRMLELLQPYAGQRGRIIRMLSMAGYRAPAFGPRRRIVPIARY